jgi:Ca-activated chloride channel family protein
VPQRISSTRSSYFFSLGVLLLFFSIHFVASAFAQSSLDQVHIVPRATLVAPGVGITPPAPSGSELALNVSGRPIKVGVNLVLVPVTVTDPLDRIVIGLGRNDFQILDGKQSQEIRHFSREDSPVSLGIILDCSGSMKSKIERARDAVSEILKIGNPQDEFFLLKFADRPEQVADFTPAVDGIQSDMMMGQPRGRTALLDAIYLGLSKMRQARFQKKALLIISDGGDNHSRYTEGELKALVKEADVTIYAIGIYDHYFATHEELLGPALLGQITNLTGGRTFTVDNPNDLPLIARRIGVELRDQYVLGYNSGNARRDGKWHKIKVKVRSRKPFPQLHVYAKAGYYAPAE